MAKKFKTVVDRKKWIRGVGAVSKLLVTKMNVGYGKSKFIGKMCCLGQRCRQQGLSAKAIAGVAYPVNLKNNPDKAAYSHSAYYTIGNVNDDEDLTDKQREKKLKKLFKSKFGEEIEFVN